MPGSLQGDRQAPIQDGNHREKSQKPALWAEEAEMGHLNHSLSWGRRGVPGTGGEVMSKAMRGSERAARVGVQGRGTRVPVLCPDRRPPPSSGTSLLSPHLQAREPQPPRWDPVLSSLLLSCVFASLLDIYTALFKPSTTLWESWAQKPLCFCITGNRLVQPP